VSGRRVTMLDVAKGAGVHVSTVSLALRNHPKIPVARRKELWQLAIKMGYRRDPLLQTLIAYRTRTFSRRNPPTLAYVTNWDTRFGWQNITAHPQFYLGAKERALKLGYNLEHFWLGEPGLHSKRLSQILRARSINGLIIASHLPDPRPAPEFEWRHFSAVKIDHMPHRLTLHNVTNDHLGIIRLAVKRVAAAGYKRIGFVMSRGWNDCANAQWSAGFLSAQSILPEARRLPILMFSPKPGGSSSPMRDFHPVVDAAEFARWFREHRPDVILSKSSFVAPALKQLGLRPPSPVAFVDLFLNDTTGETAGVRQNHELVGATAVEILAGQIHHSKVGQPAVATSTFVEGTWVDGRSCPALSGQRVTVDVSAGKSRRTLAAAAGA
jgi:LacI family transcriptional regulator